MPKDYITILNRLPSQIQTDITKQKGWDREKKVIRTEKAIAYLKIYKRNKDWVIGYYIDNIPFTRLLASPNIEDCIEFLLKELEKQIDIHDILQP